MSAASTKWTRRNCRLFCTGKTNNPIVEAASELFFSQAYIAKAIRKKKRANLTGEERERVEREKHKIIINLWIVSLAFLFLFTGFNSLQNLQTTVNGQLGADGLL